MLSVSNVDPLSTYLTLLVNTHSVTFLDSYFLEFTAPGLDENTNELQVC